MGQKIRFLAILFLSALCGSAVRIHQLCTAADTAAMTGVSASSTYLLLGISAVALGLLLGLSLTGAVSDTTADAIRPGRTAAAIQIAAGLITLLSILWGNWGSIDVWSTLLMLLAGTASGCCLILLPLSRRRASQSPPAAELIPVIYLILRLVLDFRHWSIDPIIQDYCIRLFAMIFILLAVYRSAGFRFSCGKPRAALFSGAAAVYFSAVAASDCLCTREPANAMFYLGLLLWLLPTLPCLLRGKIQQS